MGAAAKIALGLKRAGTAAAVRVAETRKVEFRDPAGLPGGPGGGSAGARRVQHGERTVSPVDSLAGDDDDALALTTQTVVGGPLSRRQQETVHIALRSPHGGVGGGGGGPSISALSSSVIIAAGSGIKSFGSLDPAVVSAVANERLLQPPGVAVMIAQQKQRSVSQQQQQPPNFSLSPADPNISVTSADGKNNSSSSSKGTNDFLAWAASESPSVSRKVSPVRLARHQQERERAEKMGSSMPTTQMQMQQQLLRKDSIPGQRPSSRPSSESTSPSNRALESSNNFSNFSFSATQQQQKPRKPARGGSAAAPADGLVSAPPAIDPSVYAAMTPEQQWAYYYAVQKYQEQQAAAAAAAASATPVSQSVVAAPVTTSRHASSAASPALASSALNPSLQVAETVASFSPLPAASVVPVSAPPVIVELAAAAAPSQPQQQPQPVAAATPTPSAAPVAETSKPPAAASAAPAADVPVARASTPAPPSAATETAAASSTTPQPQATDQQQQQQPLGVEAMVAAAGYTKQQVLEFYLSYMQGQVDAASLSEQHVQLLHAGAKFYNDQIQAQERAEQEQQRDLEKRRLRQQQPNVHNDDELDEEYFEEDEDYDNWRHVEQKEFGVQTDPVTIMDVNAGATALRIRKREAEESERLEKEKEEQRRLSLADSGLIVHLGELAGPKVAAIHPVNILDEILTPDQKRQLLMRSQSLLFKSATAPAVASAVVPTPSAAALEVPPTAAEIQRDAVALYRHQSYHSNIAHQRRDLPGVPIARRDEVIKSWFHNCAGEGTGSKTAPSVLRQLHGTNMGVLAVANRKEHGAAAVPTLEQQLLFSTPATPKLELLFGQHGSSPVDETGVSWRAVASQIQRQRKREREKAEQAVREQQAALLRQADEQSRLQAEEPRRHSMLHGEGSRRNLRNNNNYNHHHHSTNDSAHYASTSSSASPSPRKA